METGSLLSLLLSLIARYTLPPLLTRTTKAHLVVLEARSAIIRPLAQAGHAEQVLIWHAQLTLVNPMAADYTRVSSSLSSKGGL